VTDQTPEIEFSEQDEKDLAVLLKDAGDATYHPVLRVWREILSENNRRHGARITIPWATAICGKYQGMTFALMPSFVSKYFELMARLVEVLDFEIDSDDECLHQHTVDDDLEHNRVHYLNLLTGWQKALVVYEFDWDCLAEDAPAHIAALGEISNFFFGEVGLTGHLGAISFDFTEADQADLATELQELQAALIQEAEGE
jgi:hypothetical protein